MGHKRISKRDKHKGKKRLFVNRQKQREEKELRRWQQDQSKQGQAINLANVDWSGVEDDVYDTELDPNIK